MTILAAIRLSRLTAASLGYACRSWLHHCQGSLGLSVAEMTKDAFQLAGMPGYGLAPPFLAQYVIYFYLFETVWLTSIVGKITKAQLQVVRFCCHFVWVSEWGYLTLMLFKALTTFTRHWHRWWKCVQQFECRGFSYPELVSGSIHSFRLSEWSCLFYSASIHTINMSHSPRSAAICTEQLITKDFGVFTTKFMPSDHYMMVQAFSSSADAVRRSNGIASISIWRVRLDNVAGTRQFLSPECQNGRPLQIARMVK